MQVPEIPLHPHMAPRPLLRKFPVEKVSLLCCVVSCNDSHGAEGERRAKGRGEWNGKQSSSPYLPPRTVIHIRAAVVL